MKFTLSILFSLFSLISLGQSKHLFGDQHAIPPDFGKDNAVILVELTEKNKINKHLEESFEKYYTGEFEMVEKEDLNSKKYSDKTKYRYVFRTAIFFQPASGSGDFRTPATNNYSFDVFDRLEGKGYGLSYEAGGYGGLIKNYVKELEKKRKSGI